MIVHACYDVNQYRLIQVSGVQSVMQVFRAVHWRILVRAVQAADGDVVVRVDEKRD